MTRDWGNDTLEGEIGLFITLNGLSREMGHGYTPCQIKEDGAELPSVVAIDTTCPDDLIKKMKIPEGSEMTMLGKVDMDTQEAYTLLFVQPNDQHGLVGISYVTPAGLTSRWPMRLESDIGRYTDDAACIVPIRTTGCTRRTALLAPSTIG